MSYDYGEPPRCEECGNWNARRYVLCDTCSGVVPSAAPLSASRAAIVEAAEAWADGYQRRGGDDFEGEGGARLRLALSDAVRSYRALKQPPTLNCPIHGGYWPAPGHAQCPACRSAFRRPPSGWYWVWQNAVKEWEPLYYDGETEFGGMSGDKLGPRIPEPLD